MRGGLHDGSEDGFTLIELLVVIIVLGVLATITVFAVRGITDEGSESARVTDERVLVTAQESHLAQFDRYGSESDLVSSGLLADESTEHDITLVSGGEDYTIVPAGGGGGAPEPPEPEPPVPPGPTAPVPTTFAGFAGESFGAGPNRIVIISDGSSMAPQWAAFVAAGTPLATTEIIWLGAGDVTSAADVDAVVSAGSTYVVAAASVPISSPGGPTFVGQYLSTRLAADEFWWAHAQGGFQLMLSHYTTTVVPGG